MNGRPAKEEQGETSIDILDPSSVQIAVAEGLEGLARLLDLVVLGVVVLFGAVWERESE